MSYQSIQDDFSIILNRGDCSDAQAQVFILQGLARIQREARLPSMERMSMTLPTADLDWFAVPSDLLEPIDVLVPDQYSGLPTALKKTSFRRLMAMDPLGWPCAYARFQGQIWVRGRVPTGVLIQMLYYGTFSPFADATSDNELSVSFPELAVYAALSYAGDQFQHPLTQTWEARYAQILASVTQAGEDVDGDGGPQSIEPMFRDF